MGVSWVRKEPHTLLAVDEEGRRLTSDDLAEFAPRLLAALGQRQLVFLLCENGAGVLLAYLTCLESGTVPLLLDAHMDAQLLRSLMDTYRPGAIYGPAGMLEALFPGEKPLWEAEGCALYDGGHGLGPSLHPELALLLATSGSTGSPKLVRLSGKNLMANAKSIAEYLELNERERPVTNLPMSYSYGMSIVNSHLLVGASLRLTRRTVLEREFWEFVGREGVTSLAGVPYTYQMFHRLGLTEMELPELKYLTQAGGKLSLELHEKFARWAQETGRRFYVMYGQTEAGPRMGYLPHDRAVEKAGSMGVPIPGGSFRLIDTEGQEIDRADQVGELVYRGENVAMGYATQAEHLVLGDEWQGELRTGDMARRDEDGFYYIVGRQKRFLKLFGNRVSLDEAESILSGAFPGVGFACVGRDDLLSVFTDSPDPELVDRATALLAQRTRLSPKGFQGRQIAAIPKNEAGKTRYAQLEELL